jgi:hypothetical protein
VNTNRSLSASMWLMIFLQTIGSVDMPGKGPRKLPAPRAYVAIIVVWSTLHLVADAGMDQAAAVMGWILALTGAVAGPFGKTATGFLSTVATQFAVPPPTTTSGPASTTTINRTVSA